MTTKLFARRHYKVVAKALATVQDSKGLSNSVGFQRAVNELVEMFADDNPSFDEAKFLQACGLAPVSESKPSSTSHSLVKVTS